MIGPQITVVTPQFCLHVTDGPVRTRLVKNERISGFLSANADDPDAVAWLASLADRFPPTLPPPGFADLVREQAAKRPQSRASFLFSGWGKKPDYGDVAFRYTVTNFEHDDDVPVDENGVSTEWRSYGGDYKHVDRTFDRPYSVAISGLDERAEALREKIEAIARSIKKGRRADEVAMSCKAVIDGWRAVAPGDCGPGVLLASLFPDGSVEAAVIEAGSARGVEIGPFTAT